MPRLTEKTKTQWSFFGKSQREKTTRASITSKTFLGTKIRRKKTNEVASFAAFVEKNNQDIKNLETLKLF